jgi:hypothetical protein
MATPLYNALLAKVRDWAARRDTATIPDSVVADCIAYGMKDIYRVLRVPAMEYTAAHAVVSGDNTFEQYTFLDYPDDYLECIYIGKRDDAKAQLEYVYNQFSDLRSFLDPYAEHYSRHRYTVRDEKFLLYPKLKIGQVVELNYYRQELYLVDGSNDVATHWLRDHQEHLLIHAALKHVGIYLRDEEMSRSFNELANGTIAKLNNEEKMRKAKGGNVQVNVNSGGLI